MHFGGRDGLQSIPIQKIFSRGFYHRFLLWFFVRVKTYQIHTDDDDETLYFSTIAKIQKSEYFLVMLFSSRGEESQGWR